MTSTARSAGLFSLSSLEQVIVLYMRTVSFIFVVLVSSLAATAFGLLADPSPRLISDEDKYLTSKGLETVNSMLQEISVLSFSRVHNFSNLSIEYSSPNMRAPT